jgi:ribosomal protein S18 acetylase RimI-like enzyme
MAEPDAAADVRLRPASPADLPRIAALGRWVWLDSYADAGVSSSFAAYVEQAFSIATLEAELQRGSMWLIAVGDQLQAWAQLGEPQDGRIELMRLYVVPPCHGQGLGARLLRQVRAAHPRQSVWLSAWEGNAGALRFYRREGAQVQGETWFELDGQRHRNEVLGWPALEAAP